MVGWLLLTGSYSRRNSHCSIIQTSEAVVLVQCRPDMGAENRKSIDIVTFDYRDVDTPRNSVHDTITEPGSGCDSSSSSSSSGSLDVDLRHPPSQSQHYTTRVHVSSNCPSTKVQHHTNSSNYHSTHLQNPSNRLSTQLNTTSYCHPTKVQNRHSTQVLNSPEKPQSQIQSSSNRLSAQFQSSNRPVQSSSNRLSAQVYNNPNHLAQDQNNAKRLSVQTTPSHPPKQVEAAPSRVSSQAQSSSDIELNIRQMEETQRRINLTLETLLQLRQTQRRQHHDRRSCSQTRNGEWRTVAFISCLFVRHKGLTANVNFFHYSVTGFFTIVRNFAKLQNI